jgi:hypothetical protein
MITAIWAALLLQAAAPPAQPITPIVLRAGTPIRFVTEAAIDSRSVRQGQRFALAVAEDLTEGPRIIIPKGTKAVGEVEAVSGKGMFGKAGSLSLRPLFIEIGGQRINLEGAAEEVGKEQVRGAAIATVLTGGLGLIITGKSAKLDAGSPLTGWVRNDATILPQQ